MTRNIFSNNKIMKQYTHKEFVKILTENGYTFNRSKGSHFIYSKEGHHISVPKILNSCIARRLIKENNLKI